MSEADTRQEPNQSQSLPELTTPIHTSVIDGIDGASSENQEDTAESVEPVTNLDVARDISADLDRDPILSILATDNRWDASATDVAATENTAITPAQESNLLGLIQKLRQRNRGLLKQVNYLEQSLGECQDALQSRKAKTQAQENIIAKAAQEITTSQEQITRLFRELELSHQVAQRQQILIETLTEQLESSQERMAQMERECALTQQRCNDQSHLLLQTENTVRQLCDRLHRQQRHTLQFKAALEKCLEVRAINYEANTEVVNSSVSVWSQDYLSSILASPGVLPKAQPIQPWSAQPELLADDSSLVEESQAAEQMLKIEKSVSAVETLDEDHTPVEESLVISQRSINDHEEQMMTREYQFPPDVEEMPNDQTDEPESYDLSSSMIVLSSTKEELTHHLQDASAEPAWFSQVIDEPEADLSSAPPTIWVDDWGSQLYLDQDNQNLEKPEFPSLSLEGIPQSEINEAEMLVSLDDGYGSSEPGTYPTQNPQDHLSQTNWPSPVVYPLRPSRGRKSLAAVELPIFPRLSDQQSSEPENQQD